jgi:TonB-dependent SusC/RagA subfamily outer membrane receptor
MKKNLIIMLMLFCYGVQGQVRTITGVVSDASGALPGANVIIKGSNNGVQTDFDGIYSIQAKTGDILEFNFVGYITQTIEIKQTNTISAVLSTDFPIKTDCCYEPTGIKKKVKVALQTIPNPNILELQQSKAPGLATMQKPKVIFRCGYPLQTEPLYIVDGAPVTYKEFRELTSEDIKSVHVLKDAAATAIYGSRGASGVIVIMTKDCENYDKYVTGLVTDESGVPLKNILIQVENWPNFELTEFDGQFFIGVKKNQALVISDPDYKSITIKAEQLGNRNIVLERRR